MSAIARSLVLLAITLASCGRAPTPPGDDEARARSAFEVPASATLVSLTASPLVSGTFGREGLRIAAIFEVPAAERAALATTLASRAGWTPLPLPPLVATLRDPPLEILGAIPPEGLGFCQVDAYVTGQTFTPQPCTEPPPPRIDRYRIATYAPSTGRLSTVWKAYY